MKDEPCNICGSTDLNLIDGFYYCVECGTQDVNVQETVVEQTYLADGTTALVSGKRFATIVKDGLEMSGEWHKWHAYNFILNGLTEELINLGAKSSVKMKVLWIWVRYMKRFQAKEELYGKNKIEEGHPTINRISEAHDASTDSESEEVAIKMQESTPGKFVRGIQIVTKGLLLAILYLALNFDKSNIQLSHLFRFIREGRLSILKCTKFVPKGIDTKSIPHWKSFLLCQSDYNSHTIRAYAMTCIKILDLGHPILPDFNKIIQYYIRELCLPNEFKNLVFSLMIYLPCHHIDMDMITEKLLVRLPDYETVAMSYILVALKMCFGLDGDYEVRLSDVVGKINDEENRLKTHTLGMYSEPTDRLFSFLEWTRFLQFRKTILCQYYLPMATQYNQEVDDYVLMEHMEERNVRPIKLRDEVTMDILNKIPYQKEMNLIPKSAFPPCLTPMSNYTHVILNYVLNSELRLLLSEDFTQYCLNYATEKLKLFDNVKDAENLIVGVNKFNKKIEPLLKRRFESKQGDNSMVFIRKCENTNWLKTNPPTAEHIMRINEIDTSNGDSGHGYESNIEDTVVESNVSVNDEEDIKLECFEEENGNVNIFDDHFEEASQDDKSFVESTARNDTLFDPYSVDISESISNASNNNINFNDFDRVKIIDELVYLACKKYKIQKPRVYEPRQSKKRKNKNVDTEAGESTPKRRKPIETKQSDARMKVNDYIVAYYNNIDNDILTKVSEQVRNAIRAEENREEAINNTMSHDEINGELGNGTLPEQDANFEHNDSMALLNKSNDNATETNTEEDEDLDAFIKKEDPDFDARTHDIEQLYVKLSDNIAFNDSINLNDDPEIDQIILSQIGEICYYDIVGADSVKNLTDTEDDNNDSKGGNYVLEKATLCKDREKTIESFEPLIKHPSRMNKFNYWLRHYGSRSMAKNLDMHQKFDVELNGHYPASFNFVLHECSALVGCSTFSLYRSLQNLENMIIAKSKC